MENLELMPKSYCVKRVWKDHTPTTVRLGNITQISTRLDLKSLGLYNGSDLDENVQQLMNSNSDEIGIENNTAASDDQQWTLKTFSDYSSCFQMKNISSVYLHQTIGFFSKDSNNFSTRSAKI